MSQNTSEDVGEVKDTSVVVTRTVSKPVKDVWVTLMSPLGATALLGPGGEITQKGHIWRASDGAHGVTRSFHPLEQIRFSWHKDDDAPASLVDLKLHADGDGTKLEIVHKNLDSEADLAMLEERWTSALERIAEAS